jgi:hypothetical protein
LVLFTQNIFIVNSSADGYKIMLDRNGMV